MNNVVTGVIARGLESDALSLARASRVNDKWDALFSHHALFAASRQAYEAKRSEPLRRRGATMRKDVCSIVRGRLPKRLLLLALVVATGGAIQGCDPQPPAQHETGPTETLETGGSKARLHAVRIVAPRSMGGLSTASLEASGSRAAIACATCHVSLDPSKPPFASGKSNASEFHSSVNLAHGTLVCGSCHNRPDPSQLHLADGAPLVIRSIEDSIQLCGQCHGSQYRDYQHGAHGGMRGYWDLRQGPRERNHCVACHGAHAPAFPPVMPVPGPNDRFTGPKKLGGSVIHHRFGGEAHE